MIIRIECINSEQCLEEIFEFDALYADVNAKDATLLHAIQHIVYTGGKVIISAKTVH